MRVVAALQRRRDDARTAQVRLSGDSAPAGWPPGSEAIGLMLAPLFSALADSSPAPDAALPDTGVGLELERLLSPAFIRGEAYGTRCSTLVLGGSDGFVFAERRYGPGGQTTGDSLAFIPLDGSLPPA